MYRNYLKKAVTAIAALALVLYTAPAAAAEDAALSLSAESAVLLSADTGTVLYEKNSTERRSMASTTKIMTALLALEEAERSDDPAVDVTEEMVAVEGSSMGLQAGDKLTLSNLAAGMLLASGNDAANSAALYLDGSQEEFAKRMNRRAEEMGLTGTHFVTPSGLDDEEHYSTAMDMALLAREALKNDWFRQLCGSSTYQVEFLEPEKRVSYTNHNKLLRQYEGCIGVKTGFTKKSGRCLVSAAQRDGVTLIAVTLNAPDDWNDHTRLLDYGFSKMESVSLSGSDFSAQVPVVGGTAEMVKVSGGEGGAVCLPKEAVGRVTRKTILPAFCYAPVKRGDRVGELKYYLDGTPIYSVPIYAEEDVAIKPREPSFWERLFGKNG